ncbi:hypothetical protein JZ751_010954 [Albula glossodonta]|uniref:Uncharacterized protein n=1 Tax=Albula glossodonta TaxID=121402 RepID=A0A8T2NVB6_9TELE|nr:hypothetical protein JZ751_010954 [Albula glossodonta]
MCVGYMSAQDGKAKPHLWWRVAGERRIAPAAQLILGHLASIVSRPGGLTVPAAPDTSL